MNTESYKVRIAGFEGPFDLLLSLIEKRKLFINDISLSKVTDDFIGYVKSIEKFPLALSANFILIASTLLLIKSRSLLPALQLTEEEEGSIDDLERRLKIYKRMKELGLHIRERFGREIIFARQPYQMIEPVFSPDKRLSAQGIFTSIKEVLKNLPKVEILPKAIVQKVITLEEMIKRLTERITSSLKMSFKEFSGTGKVEKVNVIVGFLAMLELVKQGIISVTQQSMFDDIEMETTDLGIPRY